MVIRKLRPIATPSVVPKTKGRTILALPQWWSFEVKGQLGVGFY